MPKSSGGEYEHHVVGVRLRVVGDGDLRLILSDLDDTRNQHLLALNMQPVNRFEPTRLANFQSQRIRLTGNIGLINDYFRIQRIIIFAKPVAVEYPSGLDG